MKDIQVILLCGGSSNELYPLLDYQIKHLLPVFNTPIIDFNLNLLYNHFLYDVIILTNYENRHKLEKYIGNLVENNHKYRQFKFQFHNSNNFKGVMEMVYELRDKSVITKDFILLSGDLITDINMNNLIDYHYKNDSDLTILFTEKEKSDDDKVILFTNKENEIIKYYYESDIKDNGFNFKPINFINNNKLLIKNNFDIGHVFICSVNIINIFKYVKDSQTNFFDSTLPFIINNNTNKKLFEVFKEGNNNLNNHSYYNVINSKKDYIKVIGYFNKCYNKRIDNLSQYKKINLDSLAASKLLPNIYNNKENNLIKNNLVIGKDCEIINNKDINNCIIGNKVIIKDNCKIKNSILLNDITIESNTQITNCIIGNKCVIKMNNKLTDCVISHNCIIKEGLNYENEFICNIENQDIVFEEEVDFIAKRKPSAIINI